MNQSVNPQTVNLLSTYWTSESSEEWKMILHQIAPNNTIFWPKSTDFLFLHKYVCCGYSLEVPCRGASNEHPQHMFSWWNKKHVYPDIPTFQEI